MFDKLDDIVERLQVVLEELSDPDVINNQAKYRQLMKEQNDLTPIVEKYTEYKKAKQTVEDSLELLEIETDEEMREMAKEDLNDAKKQIEELENELDRKSVV